MNRVDLILNGIPQPPRQPSLKKNAVSFVRKVLKILGKKNWDISVLFCDNAYIKTLNHKFRKKNSATDVLSFPLGETIEDGKGRQRFLPGDIIVSLESMEANAASFGVSSDEELKRLLIHGILHLDGMDHFTNKKSEPMLILQENILSSLIGEEILCAG